MKEYDYINIIKQVIDQKSDIIGDDTAIITDKGLVLTCDTLVENVHFRLSTTSAYNLGYKAAAVNLSDIAASTGLPDYMLVALSLPEYIDKNFISDLYKGINDLASSFNCSIVGGDLTKSNSLIITITVVGHTKNFSSRKNAKIKQKIFTTGNFGASFLGLLILENKISIEDLNLRDYLVSRHLKPFPRVKESQYLVNTLNYKGFCMMDTSDGLADCLFQIAQKSNKNLRIFLDKIPIHKGVAEFIKSYKTDLNDIALFGGEDFELVFTCNPRDIDKLIISPYNFYELGEVIEEGANVDLIYDSNTIMNLTEEVLEKKLSFKHF